MRHSHTTTVHTKNTKQPLPTIKVAELVNRFHKSQAGQSQTQLQLI